MDIKVESQLDLGKLGQEVQKLVVGREQEFKDISKKVLEKEELGLIVAYMESVSKGSPDFRILLRLYYKRIERSIEEEDTEKLEKYMQKVQEMGSLERREYLKKVYKSKKEGYVNVFMEENEWEEVTIIIQCTPFKIKERDDVYYLKSLYEERMQEMYDGKLYDIARENHLVNMAVFKYVDYTVRKGKLKVLKWWLEYYRQKRHKKFSGIIRFNILNEISRTENTEMLEYLQQKYKFSVNFEEVEEQKKKDIKKIYCGGAIEIAIETGNKKMMQWYQDYIEKQ